MANVLHYENVKNEQDLQNLVIGIIFRMDKPYKNDNIVILVNRYLRRSVFQGNTELIRQHVNDSLDLVQLHDKVRCINGTYYPKNPITKSFPPEYYQRMRTVSCY